MKMFNFNLDNFVKTKLAQQIQQSQIGNFVKQKGAPAIISTIIKQIIGEKPKVHEGVDMGQQVEPGIIPIVYGHVGMSNTQFDKGQKPSDIDAEFVTQEVRMPISEGSIIGVAKRLNDNEVSLPCGHAFHSDCILTWISKKMECPYCKTKLSWTSRIRSVSVDSADDNNDNK